MLTNANDNDRVRILAGASTGQPATVTSLNVTPDGGSSLKLDFESLERLTAAPPTANAVEIIHADGSAVSDKADGQGAYIGDVLRAKVTGPVPGYFEWDNQGSVRSDHDDTYQLTNLEDGETLLVRTYDRAGGTKLAESKPIYVQIAVRPGAAPIPTPVPPIKPPPVIVVVEPPPTPSQPAGITRSTPNSPYRPTSPWNLTRAQKGLKLADYADPRGVIRKLAVGCNWNAWGSPVFIASASDPMRHFTAQDNAKGVDVHCPASLSASRDADALCTIIDVALNVVVEMWGFNGASWAKSMQSQPLNGDGVSGGMPAADISLVGGTARKWEYDGAGPICHQLGVVIPSEYMANGSPKPPARTVDGYRYSGDQFGIHMGQQYFAERVPAGLSGAVAREAQRLVDYGLIVYDTNMPGTGGGTIRIRGELTFGSANAAALVAGVRACQSVLLPAI